ncbi:MAG: hypothetical protein EA401_13200 [Planctomycetota bacterium]|nr:MAG: hypothetical protein EA401_13200 [Planctomycetota bacterium]
MVLDAVCLLIFFCKGGAAPFARVGNMDIHAFAWTAPCPNPDGWRRAVAETGDQEYWQSQPGMHQGNNYCCSRLPGFAPCLSDIVGQYGHMPIDEPLPRISVRLPEQDIAWLQQHFGSTTRGIREAVIHLRACLSLPEILADRFESGETVTIGSLLVRLDCSYQQLFRILQQAREAGALRLRMRSAAKDRHDLSGYEVSPGRSFQQWREQWFTQHPPSATISERRH